MPRARDARRVALPTYPFERRRHWIEQTPEAPAIAPPAGPPASGATDLLAELRATTGSVLGVPLDAVDVQSGLAELGVESIVAPLLAAELSVATGRAVAPEDLYNFPTLARLAAALSHRPAAEGAAVAVPPPASAPAAEAIAVVGMAGRFPGAPDLDAFWRLIAEGRSAVAPLPDTLWPGAGAASHVGGMLPDFDRFDPAFFGISPREARLMDPQQRVFLEECWRALEDAGLAAEGALEGRSVGVFAGAQATDWSVAAGAEGASHGTLGASLAILAARVAYALDFRGPALTVDTACSAGLAAVHLAAQSLRMGECEVALAGGVSVSLYAPRGHAFFADAGLLSARGACRPFAPDADGIVPADGVGVVALKRLADALRDGDTVRGVILASALNQDGRTNGITAPNGPAQAALIAGLYRQNAIAPASIGLVEAHGTGTRLGDPIELSALAEAFRVAGSGEGGSATCAIGSVKANIGHALPAAGIAGLLKVLLALEAAKLPPSPPHAGGEGRVSLPGTPFFAPGRLLDWPNSPAGERRRAAVSAFGFGGTNAHLVVEEVPPTRRDEQPPAPAGGWPILLSARDAAAMARLAAGLRDWLSRGGRDARVQDIAFTLATNRRAFPVRAAFLAHGTAEVEAGLEAVALGEPAPKENGEGAGLVARFLAGGAAGWPAGMPRGRRLRLPPYPFARERFWPDAVANVAEVAPRGDAPPIAVASPPSTALSELRSLVAEALMLEESRVPDHAGFGTLGLDSILAAELARRVNDRLGTALRAIDFYDHPTLADLAAAIEGDGANRSAPAPSMAPPPRPELHVLRAVVRGAVAEALYTEPGTIADDAGFHDLGLDSILAVELAKSISTLVSAELRAVEIYETGTVAALTDLLVERGAAAASTPASAEATRMAPATAAPAEPSPEPGQVAQTASAEPIAIIGLAGRFPGAPDIEAFWDLLRAGRDAVTEIPPERWSMDGFFDPRRGAPGRSYARWGGFLDGVDLFDPLFFRISPREAELIDPQERLFLMCAHAAVEHAGWVPGELGGGAVGVFAGVMYGEWALLAAEASTRNDFVPAHAPYWSVPNRVSFTFGWRGPSVALDTACSSSLTALHLACEALRRGECAAAVAGGVNLSLHPRKYLGLSHARFAASDGRCRSFGADGDGYVPGEGVGALVLKRLRDALADGDTVHAVVRGSAIRHGGHTSGFSVPSPGGQAEAIRSALDQAGVLPRTIGYVEAHGTGTALGDPIEIEGLKRAFGGEAAEVAVGSVKSNIGHLEAAAGVAALTKVVLQFRHGELAPSLHAERQNVELDIDGSGFAVARGPARPWPVRRDEGGACAAAARGREFLRRRWRERARGAGRGPAGHAAGRSAGGASARCAFGAFGRAARAPSHRNRADRAGPGRFLRWLGPGRPRSHPSGRSRGVARARRVRGRRPRRAARRPGCARGRAQHAWPPSRARGAEYRGWPQGNAGGAVRRPWRRRVG